jgi:hypothetical protein
MAEDDQKQSDWVPAQPVPASGVPKGDKVVTIPADSGGQGPLGGAASDLVHALVGGMMPSSGSGQAKKDPGKGKPKETAKEKAAAKAAAKAAEEQKALQAQIQAVENSPWTKLSNALTQQYAQTEVPVAAAVSGSQIPQAQESAAGTALASLGLSPGSSAGQWLQAQTGAAQAQTAPVAQAMAQEGAQYQAEAGPISQAIMAYGQANALSDITAPEASWLNALASHVQSNLSYYGLIPTASLPSLAPGVAQALKLSGGYGGAAGAGTTPLQNVVANQYGGSKPAVPGAGTLGTGTSGAGSVPGATSYP